MLVELGTHHVDVARRAVVIGVVAGVRGVGATTVGPPYDALVREVQALALAGADVVELGRGPDAEPGPAAERAAAAVSAVRGRVDVPLAWATEEPAVLRAAAEAGAVVAVTVAQATGAYLAAAVELGVTLLLGGEAGWGEQAHAVMPGAGAPAAAGALDEAAGARGRAEAAGVPSARLVLDVRLGAGAPDAAVAEALAQLGRIAALGHLVALSTVGWPAVDADQGREIGAQALAIRSGSRVLRTASAYQARRVRDVVATLLDASAA